MRKYEERGSEQNETQNREKAQESSIRIVIHTVEQSFSPWESGTKSQKTKESRSTTCPVTTGTAERKIGPSKTKVWNSPFSPQGSTSIGNSRKKSASNSLPAKDLSSFLGSMQAVLARNPSARKRAASSRVSTSHSGKSADIPTRVRFASR